MLIVDFLKVKVIGGQFLNQIEEIKWLLRRSEEKKGGGRFLGGQNHIRKGIIFHYLDLMMEAKMRLKRGLGKPGPWSRQTT